VEVYASVFRVLKPGRQALIATSHRCFPTKAVLAWHTMNPEDRIQLIRVYLEQAGFAALEFIDRSPANADPLWVVAGHKP
jgi:predicted methyltransferase